VEFVEFSSRLTVKIFRSRLGERDGGLRGFSESRSSSERWEFSRFSSGFSCIFFSLVDDEIVVKLGEFFFCRKWREIFTDNFEIYRGRGGVI
jgi:hypothetical protein